MDSIISILYAYGSNSVLYGLACELLRHLVHGVPVEVSDHAIEVDDLHPLRVAVQDLAIFAIPFEADGAQPDVVVLMRFRSNRCLESLMVAHSALNGFGSLPSPSAITHLE